jgi:hypothetical protein
MSPDSFTATPSVLAPRAAVALLTLQLRAASQEAVAAEHAVVDVDTAAVVSELRSRIGPLAEDRRRALDDELARTRAEVVASVAAARTEAMAIVAEATDGAAAADAVHRVTVDATTMWEPPTSDLVSGLSATPFVPNPDCAHPITVVLDADLFARAFAIALAPLLEDRLRPSVQQPTQVVRVVQPAFGAKKSFWRNAWHVDVVLSGIAMVIVLAVLVAWTN